MGLPDRSSVAEDAYVADWASSDDTDGLLQAIEDAMEARRPTLAARLVGLLGDHVEIEPGSAIEAATRAARLVLMPTGSPAEHLFNALDEAWAEVRRSRMRRIKNRMRDALNGRNERHGRLSGRKRGRR